MWTPDDRAQLAREHLPYATCMSDQEWQVVEPFLPPAAAWLC